MGPVMTNGMVITIIMVAAVLGPAIVIAVLGAVSIKALGRNPSAAAKIYLGVFLMIIFAEAIAIMALLVVFEIFNSNPTM
jgi:F0F1-type ATP synthase membrane subunit c/vacuolar-type H+-ATPase subunit K